MNFTKVFLQRESGSGYIKDYSGALKRLKCFYQDEYYGIEPSFQKPDFNAESPVYAYGFSSVLGYQHLLALGNEDGKIAIQDIRVPSNHKQCEGHQAHRMVINDLAWIPSAFKLVTASGDSNATLWDIQNGNSFVAVMHFTAHSKSVKTVAVCPHNRDLLATGSRDGIMLWDTRLDRGIVTQLRPDNSIPNPHFPSATHFSRSRRCRNAPAPAPAQAQAQAQAQSHAATVTSLVIQDDRHLISCGASDCLFDTPASIKVWDLRKSYSTYRRDPQPSHRLYKSKRGDGMGFTCLRLDFGHVRLYASCSDSTIYAFNVSTFEELPIAAYSGHEFSNSAKSCLSPDGRYLLSGSKDTKAYIWEVDATHRRRHRSPGLTLEGHDGEVTAVAWCPVGDTRLVTCSDDGWHRVWRVSEEDLANRPCGQAMEPTHWNSDKELVVDMTVNVNSEPTQSGAVPSTPDTSVMPGTPAMPRSVLQLTPHSEGGWRSAVEKTPDGSCPRVRGCRKCCGDPNVPCTRCKPASLAATSKKRLEALWEVNEDLLSPKNCEECQLAVKRVRVNNCEATPVQEAAPRGREMRKLFSPAKACSDMLGIAPICDGASEVASLPLAPIVVCPHRRMSVLSSPTLNLPNYVVDGTSPHHQCNRDSRQHKENLDWLTRLRKERGSAEKKKLSMTSPVTPTPVTSSSNRKRPRKSSVEPGPSSSSFGSEQSSNRMQSSASIAKFFILEG